MLKERQRPKVSTETRPQQKQPLHRAVFKRVRQAIINNWQLKILSLLVALVVWGALISEDPNLTREKTFTDVPISITGVELLQRNGLIIVEGLEDLPPLRMRAQVPQKSYAAAIPANFSVRVDVSRITQAGEQTVPIQTLSTTTFGTVEWMSTNEIKVKVDEYITRRRVPVKLTKSGQTPEGYYSASTSADPNNVVISGPRSLVEKISTVSASYNPAQHDLTVGVQYSAVPFKLLAADGTEIKSNLISVTSENVLLDTLLVEQVIYPTKFADINLTGLLKGKVAEGYQVIKVTADPPQVRIAGNEDELASLKLLDLSSVIDVEGLSDTVIRALRVEKPQGVLHMSDSAVYVTVEIGPVVTNKGN